MLSPERFQALQAEDVLGKGGSGDQGGTGHHVTVTMSSIFT